MVDRERDSESVDENTEATGAGEADPMLDIVRQLIVEAEAVPAPARRPPGPATPRPATPYSGAVPPAPVVTSTSVSEPFPGLDAGPEAWDEDLETEEDDWDDLSLNATARPYGIIDVATGEIVGSDGEDYSDAYSDTPAAPDRARKRLLRRWLGAAMRALGAFVGAALRALAAWTGARLAEARRAAARFLRRPDAPRRLAGALLVIFVIAWPWKVLWLTLLIPLAALIAWASVGSEGFAELVVRAHARLKAHDADKAERIRLRAAATSRALGRGLERLPERWTQGLYLPDFEPEGYVPDTLKVDPFEDLAARVHSAKRAGDG